MTSIRGFAKLRVPLAVALGAVVLTVGCGVYRKSPPSLIGDEPKNVNALPVGRRGSAVENTARATRSETISNPEAVMQEQRIILGTNAAAVAAVLRKPHLECIQPIDTGVLCASRGEEDSRADLVYECRVTGHGLDRVSGVEARLCRSDDADFRVDSQALLNLNSTQLQYREYKDDDREHVYGFINDNLGSDRTTASVGATEWTSKTSEDCRALTVALMRCKRATRDGQR